MTAEAQQVISQVFALPAAVREEVLTHLIKQMDAEPEPTPQERAEIDTAWRSEINRRAAEVRADQADLMDGEEALHALRKKFGE